MIERNFNDELQHLRSTQFKPASHSSAVLSSIAMALKYNKTDALSADFWLTLNDSIRLYLQNLPEEPDFAQLREDDSFKESLNLIHTSIEANPDKLDQALIALIRNFLF